MLLDFSDTLEKNGRNVNSILYQIRCEIGVGSDLSFS